MTQSARRPIGSQVDIAVTKLAEIVRPIVEAIEISLPITKDHYGDYLVALPRIEQSLPPGGQETTRYLLVAAACKVAGGNPSGIRAALRILGVEPAL